MKKKKGGAGGGRVGGGVYLAPGASVVPWPHKGDLESGCPRGRGWSPRGNPRAGKWETPPFGSLRPLPFAFLLPSPPFLLRESARSLQLHRVQSPEPHSLPSPSTSHRLRGHHSPAALGSAATLPPPPPPPQPPLRPSAPAVGAQVDGYLQCPGALCRGTSFRCGKPIGRESKGKKGLTRP